MGETTGRVAEFNGPQAIEEAAIKILHTDTDVVVIRGLVAAHSALDYVRNSWYSDASVDVLYGEVPGLHAVDEEVSRYWDNHGYTDYSLVKDHLTMGHVHEGAIGVHTDYSHGTTRELRGPLSLSLCLSGNGVYYAQKPRRQFINADGTFDEKRWRTWGYLPFPRLHRLRSSTTQRAGDGVLLMNHPEQTFHAVKAKGERSAGIFDYRVQRSVHEQAFPVLD